MFGKVLSKFKDNGLDALGDLVSSGGNPIGIIKSIGTLIGKPDIDENDLLKQLDNPEVVKILKEHEYLMAKLENEDRVAYLNAYSKRDEALINKMQINNDNTADARRMGIKTGMKFQNKFAMISFFVLILFLSFLVYILVYAEVSAGTSAILNSLVGLIGGLIGGLFNYYFGSKDDGKDLIEHKRIDSKW